nr:BFH_HP1_G0048810.mRNA.1.CDS.1 [Saccharomyces cerevisiae]
MALERELLVATQAVRKADFSQGLTTITKSDNSPVTTGDYAAQTIIINAIKSNFLMIRWLVKNPHQD